MNSFFQFGGYRPFPPGSGFPLFGAVHLGVLAFLLLAGGLIVRGYRRSDEAKRARIRGVFAALIVVLEGGKDVLLVATGQWVWSSLPLHLCSWAMVFVVWDTLRPGKLSREVLYALCLPGAVAALATPDWASNPILNIFTWQSFLIHASIVTYIMARLTTRELVPQARQLWLLVLFLLVVIPSTMVVNHFLGTNYFFLSTPAPGSPLAPIHDIFGSWYLLGMALLVAFIWLVLYAPWGAVAWRHRVNLRLAIAS